jgi:hypothetical protein
VSAVDDAINLLQQKKHSLRCSELTQTLEGLRFRVRDGRKGGHKVVSHLDRLEDFHGSGFNGGHGTDDEVKACYVSAMITMLRVHKDDLERVLGTSP